MFLQHFESGGDAVPADEAAVIEWPWYASLAFSLCGADEVHDVFAFQCVFLDESVKFLKDADARAIVCEVHEF